jgi:hypothetical protein
LLHVFRQPLLRGLAIGYGLNMVTWGILWVAVPVYAAQRFAVSGWQAVSGLLWAGMGLAEGSEHWLRGNSGYLAGKCR